MRKEFEVHILNEDGIKAADSIAGNFHGLLCSLEGIVGDGADQRCLAIVRTKMEEACFFAKKSMACSKRYQK